MSKQQQLVERLFDGLEIPRPEDELRSQVLTPAMAALLQPQPEADLWTRLWFSRPLRLAWGACLVALILGHLAITPWDRVHSASTRQLATLTAAVDGELAEITQLPSIVIGSGSLFGQGSGRLLPPESSDGNGDSNGNSTATHDNDTRAKENVV